MKEANRRSWPSLKRHTAITGEILRVAATNDHRFTERTPEPYRRTDIGDSKVFAESPVRVLRRFLFRDNRKSKIVIDRERYCQIGLGEARLA
jgi:hypothetical protein